MGVQRVDDFEAFRLAQEFKREAYRVVSGNALAARDVPWRQQVFDSASGVESCMAEGFKRRTPGEFARFLRYSLASLEEATRWLRDGVDRGYYGPQVITGALALARQCDAVMEGLYRSQVRRRNLTHSRRRPDDRRPPESWRGSRRHRKGP
jgi:four helix bundle protein